MFQKSCSHLFRTNVGSPLVQTLRYRSRNPNIKKPAIPHWRRAVMLQITKPQYADPLIEVQPAELCPNKKKFEKQKIVEVNPFEQILAKEFLEKVEESKVVAIFHSNPMSTAELYALRLQLSKLGLFYHHLNNKIANLAFSRTKYEAMLPLYVSNTVTFLGDENVKVAKLLKMQKRFRSLVLIAGVVEGRLMSVSDLQRFASLPSLPVLQSQMLGIINAPLQRLTQNLCSHQTDLSSALGRYIADQIPDTEKEDRIEAKTDGNCPESKD